MSDAVEQIKEKLTIVDVVTPYVELHRAGKNYKGKSPFTSEKTPSFYVSPDRGLYYCFSSSQGGDMFNFIQAMEGVDFKGALKILADKAGVELVAEDPQKRSERDSIFAALQAAAQFYATQLPKQPEAQHYVSDRGCSDRTIQKWQLGYAPGPPHGGWRELRSHLNSKGITDDILLKAGLIKLPQGGKEPFDVFRDRIMFPMCDPSGRVVAFSGRLLTKESEAPKYVNTPETELYKKSELLFGYDKAKEGIRKLDFSLIVEGQFDVVLAHQAGYTNTVAVSGTALTMHHVQLLERLSGRVLLALDADRAGVAAVKRAAELMLARGLDVKVAELPQGEDPADIITDDMERFKRVIGSATHVIEFLLHVLRREAGDERAFKLRVREEVVPFLVLIDNRIDREHFETVVAEAIGSTKDAVHFEVSRREEQQKKSTAGSETAESTAAAAPKIEQGSQSARRQGLETYCVMLAQVLEGDEKQFIEQTLAELYEESLSDLLARIPESLQSEYAFTIDQSLEEWRDYQRREQVEDAVNELAVLIAKERIRSLRVELQTAEARSDDAMVAELLQKLHTAQAQLARPRRTIATT